MAVISKIIRDGRGFFRMLSGIIADLQTADPSAVGSAAVLYYRSDLKRWRMQDDAGVFANLAREDAGQFTAIVGPTNGGMGANATGVPAQLGTGPAAAFAGSALGGILTVTPGTGPSIFVANTPYLFATITVPAGLFSAAPNNVSIDACNQLAAQSETGSTGIAFWYDQANSTATSILIKAVSAGTPTLSNAAYKFSIGIVG